MFLKKIWAELMLLAMLCVLFPVASYAQGTANSSSMNISLSQAITMSETSNSGLAESYNQLQQSEDTMKSYAASYSTGKPLNAYANTQATQAYLTLINNDYQDQYAWKCYEYEKNNIIYQTESAYFGVQDAVYGEQVAELAVEQAQNAYLMAQISQLEGVDTQSDVISAKSTLDGAQSQLTAAQSGVDAAYVNFDNTVGLSPDERPALTTAANYNENYDSGLSDIQQAVSDAVNNSTLVFSAQTTVTNENQTQIYASTVQLGALQYQYDQMKLQDAISTATLEARTAYLAVGTAQDAYDAAEKAVLADDLAYQNAQATYSAGVITRSALLGAQLLDLSAHATLQSDLHTLLLDQANLALITGVGSVTIPVSGN